MPQPWIDVPADTWTLLTTSDVVTLTFQNVGLHQLFIKPTVGTSAPANTNGAAIYVPLAGERNMALADLFPGVSGANRLWAFGRQGGRMMVSHA
jgi:hypothetical protein